MEVARNLPPPSRMPPFFQRPRYDAMVKEGSRYDSHSAQSTQDRRKLLKRTRSLAVISEDDSRQDREATHFRLGQSTFDLPRRHQLIPRAKLIDRNSLKD
ncbi:hypothetical protein P5V15_000623, partial [Pogonomyrmex californicus]